MRGVTDVAMRPVDEVEVIVVGHRLVPAIVGMHVHVPAVRQMVHWDGVRNVVHMIAVGVMDVAVVQEVEVIVVLDRRVPTESIMGVLVFVVRPMSHGWAASRGEVDRWAASMTPTILRARAVHPRQAGSVPDTWLARTTSSTG